MITFEEAKQAMRTANVRVYKDPPFVEAQSMIDRGPFLIVTTNKDAYDLPWRALRMGRPKDPDAPASEYGGFFDMSVCVRIVDAHGHQDWIGRTASVLPIPADQVFDP